MLKKGMSLIELMVAITLLTIVISAAISLSVSLIHQERRSLATQNIMDNSSYFLEYGGRFIRMAQEDDGSCITTAGLNYENGADATSIRFLDYEDHCHEFLLADGQIKERVSSDNTSGSLGSLESAVAITSPKATVSSLSFAINGDDASHQPRVTIKFAIQNNAFQEASMDVETTISQRNLNS